MGESYLDRYLHGEHEEVWNEMVALGEQVRAEANIEDARAVARETMQRARCNIEMLIPRLVAIGYQFGYGWIQPYVQERLLQPYRANYDASTGKYAQAKLIEPTMPHEFSVGQRLAYEELLELANEQPPLFTPANDIEQRLAQLEANIARSAPAQDEMRAHWRNLGAELQAKPSPKDLLDELEALLGELPLSIRAWYEEVGGVNFVGDHPQWRALLPERAGDLPMNQYDYLNPMHMLDPLVMIPLTEERVANYRKWTQQSQPPRSLLLAEDQFGKYLDGSRDLIEMLLPNAAADAPVSRREIMFVDYIRQCFRLGGFPGWATIEQRPEDDLAFLTRDLLPL